MEQEWNLDTNNNEYEYEYGFEDLSTLPSVNTLYRGSPNIHPGGRKVRGRGRGRTTNQISPGKGQSFSETEIKTILYALYEGKDSSGVADVYLSNFPFSSRT